MCCEGFRRTNKEENTWTSKGAHVFFQLYVCVCLCVVYITLILLILVRECVAISRRARIANLVGEDSCCREGIVNIRVVFLASFSYGPSPKALWRFRASTSNSPSGRSRPHPTRPFVIFIILTLNKIFEYVKMTIFSRPRGSPRIPRRFRFFA